MKVNKQGITQYRNQLLVARILAGRYHLRLVIDGCAQTASTDGQNLWYPLSWTLAVDDDMAAVMDGAIDHEAAGHGRHTDFSAKRSKIPLVRHLENVFEDIRIETLSARDWPGIAGNLANMIKVLVKWGFFGSLSEASDPKQQPGQILLNGLLLLCRARLLPQQGETLGPLAAAAEALCRSTFGPVWERVWELAQTSPTLGETKDAIKLAQRVYKLLRLEGAKLDTSEPSPPVPTRGKQKKGDGGAISGVEAEASVAIRAAIQAACAANESDLRATDLSEIAGQQIVKRQVDHAKFNGAVSFVQPIETQPFEVMPDLWQTLGRRVKNGIASELEVALEAKVNQAIRPGASGNRLYPGALCRIRTGDARVFLRRAVTEELSTAVSLLFDTSASMVQGMDTWIPEIAQCAVSSPSVEDLPRFAQPVARLDAAGAAIFALGEVLDAFAVPFEVTQYGHYYAFMKRFEDDWQEVRRRSRVMDTQGHTYTGMAMTVALARLAEQESDRKILISVTDGVAEDGAVLSSAYRFAKDEGFDVVTLFIGDDVRGITNTRAILRATGHGNRFAVVSTVDQLAANIIDAVRSSI